MHRGRSSVCVQGGGRSRERQEGGADLFAGDDIADDALTPSTRDHGANAGSSGDSRGFQFGAHPAGAYTAGGGACKRGKGFIDAGDGCDQFRRRRAENGGIGVEPFNIGEDEQQIGLDQSRDQRRQGVVVAELDLIDGDRVVFIDDRDDAHLQQGQQGVAGIQEAPAVGEIVASEKHLRAVHIAPGERLGVGMHQAHLPDRRRRLLKR